MKNFIKPLYVLAIILLAAVVADVTRWILITSMYDTFEQMSTAYESVFPESLQDGQLITVIKAGMLAISLSVFVKAKDLDFRKTLSVVFIIFTAIVLAWHIFTLM